MYTVYMHIFPNGKRYVGITGQKVKDRWRVNGNGYKPQMSVSEASKLERQTIAKYQTTNPMYGYNQSIGGENSPIGVKRSEETRRKLSVSHIGKKNNTIRHLTEEEKQHLREINIGKHLSEETRRKISKANKGTKPTAYAVEMCKKACNKPVICLLTGIKYESATIASRDTGEPRNTITRHCRGEVQVPRWKFQK